MKYNNFFTYMSGIFLILSAIARIMNLIDLAIYAILSGIMTAIFDLNLYLKSKI